MKYAKERFLPFFYSLVVYCLVQTIKTNVRTERDEISH